MTVFSGSFAYCTLLTNDAYVIGALVLAQSLRNTDTAIPLCAIVIAEAVSADSREKLSAIFDTVIEVPSIAGVSVKNLETIGRPDLHATLTKLQPWSLVKYDRVVYLDADTLVLRNIDHLFSLPAEVKFAAAPELGFPDCFNSGVMLLTPSTTTFAELKQLAENVESFDGGDQGLLNIYFGDGTFGHPVKQSLAGPLHTTPHAWYRLSFTYNMEMHKVYRLYISAVRRYGSEHKVLHFIGKDKPWGIPDGKVDLGSEPSEYLKFYTEMVGKWWEVRHQLKIT